MQLNTLNLMFVCFPFCSTDVERNILCPFSRWPFPRGRHVFRLFYFDTCNVSICSNFSFVPLRPHTVHLVLKFRASVSDPGFDFSGRMDFDPLIFGLRDSYSDCVKFFLSISNRQNKMFVRFVDLKSTNDFD